MLRTRHVGRLQLDTGRGPRSMVLAYGLTDHQMVFQIPEYNEVLQYAPGQRVTFAVEAASPTTDAGRRVIVSGTSYRVPPEDEVDLVDAVDLPERWPEGVTTHVMCLDLAEVEGTVDDPEADTTHGID